MANAMPTPTTIQKILSVRRYSGMFLRTRS